jgi:NADH:ubiquinone oxidoreductase subunit 4 (subunit M)
MALEFALFAIAVWTYKRRTRAKDKIGLYAFVAFVLFLLAAYAAASFGPPPPSVKKLAGVTLLTWLAIPWAWWFDKHREVSEPGEVATG